MMIPMYKLWLHGLYGLFGPHCLVSPERPLNLIIHSPLQHILVGNINVYIWLVSPQLSCQIWWSKKCNKHLFNVRNISNGEISKLNIGNPQPWSREMCCDEKSHRRIIKTGIGKPLSDKMTPSGHQTLIQITSEVMQTYHKWPNFKTMQWSNFLCDLHHNMQTLYTSWVSICRHLHN